ncbi:aspartate/glutamate racemase family protein, partial [Myxococcota bacterium]|nr:aspartate/glutamate racemase family protein [Myxococcota bacterium]
IKMLIVACNTASAHSLPTLESRFEIPIVGVIEPGARAAVNATRLGQVGIIGTLGTVGSGVYEASISRLSDNRVITAAEPCPLFVPLADEGWISGEVPRLVATKYLSELKGKLPDLDVIILGCTHYPVLRDTIQDIADEVFGRPITLIDSGIETAKAAKEFLTTQESLSTSKIRGDVKVFVTDSSRISAIGTRFLGEPIGWVEQVDIV